MSTLGCGDKLPCDSLLKHTWMATSALHLTVNDKLENFLVFKIIYTLSDVKLEPSCLSLCISHTVGNKLCYVAHTLGMVQQYKQTLRNFLFWHPVYPKLCPSVTNNWGISKLNDDKSKQLAKWLTMFISQIFDPYLIALCERLSG